MAGGEFFADIVARVKRLTSFLLAMSVALTALGTVRARPVADLINPSFEGDLMTAAQDCPNQQASGAGPVGWTPYYECREAGDEEGLNYAPEFKQSLRVFNPERVRSGDAALMYFNFWARNESAGVYQAVPVQTGDWLRFGVWAQLWTTDCDPSMWSPPLVTSFYEAGNLQVRVCIDTDGLPLDWDSGTVCSAWVREPAWDQYQPLSVLAQAKSDEAVVLINTWAQWNVKHNDVYLDDASLQVVDAPVLTGTVAAYIPYVIGSPPAHSGEWPRCPVGNRPTFGKSK